jgi:2-polyprenyl-3-methyl-5-hydroxy-6-metoxy-1,4-benzoquinol methylase
MDSFRPDAYWEERLRAHGDERGVGDIGLTRAYNSYLYKVRRRVFRRIVRQLPLAPGSTRVLDIGSGTGVYIEEWRRWGAKEVTGADITQIVVDRLSAAFPANRFLKIDIGSADMSALQSERFEVVSAFDVLFHIVDDARYQQAIQNAASLVMPGGWFLYSDNLVRQGTRMSHFVSRKEGSILETLKRNGFEVRKRIPMFVLMNDPVRSASPLLQRWFGIVYRGASRGELSGELIGRALYPLELAATRLVKNGPSTEVLLCRRV